MFNKYNTNNLGFTLIELLITMVITSIILGGAFSVYKSQEDTHRAQTQVLAMQQNSRMALYMMTNEIRMAGYDIDGTNGAGITSADVGSLTFTFVADDDGIDNDGDSPPVVDEPGELQTIAFVLADVDGDVDADIGRTADGAQELLAENITSLVFRYFDQGGIELTPLPIVASSLPNIKYIQIAIAATIDVNEKNFFNGNNRSLTTTVQCRNMGL